MTYTATKTTSGTVQEGTGTSGTRIISKEYPAERGLIAGTTKHLWDKTDYDDGE